MPFQEEFCNFVRETRKRTEWGKRDTGRNSNPKGISRTWHKKRVYVGKRDAKRIDPADEEIGLGPYLSNRRKKIILTKRNEENRRNRWKLPCHCLTPHKPEAPERKKREYVKGEQLSKKMLREMRMVKCH